MIYITNCSKTGAIVRIFVAFCEQRFQESTGISCITGKNRTVWLTVTVSQTSFRYRTGDPRLIQNQPGALEAQHGQDQQQDIGGQQQHDAPGDDCGHVEACQKADQIRLRAFWK